LAVSTFKTWHRSLTAAAGLAALAAVAFAPNGAKAACIAADDFADIRLPAGCLTANDGRAVRLRMFRADLAVAALSCKQQDRYNSLVTRHQDELVRQGRALRAMFARLHHGNAERELNRFITHLANKASLKRLEQRNYCRTMARVFDEAQAQPLKGLLAYVQGKRGAKGVRTADASPVKTRALAAMETAAGASQNTFLGE
jgi:hypothetical protein